MNPTITKRPSPLAAASDREGGCSRPSSRADLLQHTTPLRAFDHYCRVVNDDLLQCVLFDPNNKIGAHPICRQAVAADGSTCHNDGMTRTRLSTTVDASLLEHARTVRSDVTDAALIDEALSALIARYRSAEIDAGYAAYDEHPLDEPDEWGDLASFRRAAAAS